MTVLKVESSLLRSHREQLRESGIRDDVIEARGYWSARTPLELKSLHFESFQWRVPALVIPIRNGAGRTTTHQIRPDQPRSGGPKYENPKGSAVHLDIPIHAIDSDWLMDTSRHLTVTEGPKKVDAGVSHGLFVVGLMGVSCIDVPEWKEIGLKGRSTSICFDSDAMHKAEVYEALKDARRFLQSAGAKVDFIYLPQLPGLSKTGLDDYLRGHTIEELLALRTPVLTELARPKSTRTVEIYSADQLKDLELPEPKEIVRGIIPVGLSILAARPKIGKSFFMLDLSLAVASGGTALGSIEVEQGDVLYLGLEDQKRRMQARIRKFLTSKVSSHREFPGRLHFAHSWPKLDEGGTDELIKWLQAHPKARLVVVDIWKKVRPKRAKNAQLYEEDYDHMAMLQEIAHRFEVAIVVVHHTRKSGAEDVFDEISGSTGITAAVDACLVMHRSRSEADGEIWLTGKDIEEAHLALKFEGGHQWFLLGPTLTVTRSSVAREILDFVTTAITTSDGKRNGSGVSPLEVAEALGTPVKTIRQRMFQMERRGELVKVSKGTYGPLVMHNSRNTHSTRNRHNGHNKRGEST